MGDFFPELKKRKELIIKTLLSEENSFNKTLDRGIDLFTREVSDLKTGESIGGLYHRGDAFKSHPGIHMLSGKWGEVSLAVRIELDENEIPYFDTQVGVGID